jgi:hypothetical protein
MRSTAGCHTPFFNLWQGNVSAFLHHGARSAEQHAEIGDVLGIDWTNLDSTYIDF